MSHNGCASTAMWRPGQCRHPRTPPPLLLLPTLLPSPAATCRWLWQQSEPGSCCRLRRVDVREFCAALLVLLRYCKWRTRFPAAAKAIHDRMLAELLVSAGLGCV